MHHQTASYYLHDGNDKTCRFWHSLDRLDVHLRLRAEELHTAQYVICT